MTRSAGTTGLILAGSPPSSLIPSRMAARSTTAGTPVKSCSTTREGMKGTSAPALVGLHDATASTWPASTYPPPACRRAFSSKILMEKGRRSREDTTPLSSRRDNRYTEVEPSGSSSEVRAPKGSMGISATVGSWSIGRKALPRAPTPGPQPVGRPLTIHELDWSGRGSRGAGDHGGRSSRGGAVEGRKPPSLACWTPVAGVAER